MKQVGATLLALPVSASSLQIAQFDSTICPMRNLQGV
jgi:hypothetical protein